MLAFDYTYLNFNYIHICTEVKQHFNMIYMEVNSITHSYLSL